jgi:hypothetical protein
MNMKNIFISHCSHVTAEVLMNINTSRKPLLGILRLLTCILSLQEIHTSFTFVVRKRHKILNQNQKLPKERN